MGKPSRLDHKKMATKVGWHKPYLERPSNTQPSLNKVQD
ncbi:hypothetical protein PPIS_a0083 [Pseudoalteromonas piscicida]|uniref:Uncharacterized protein n=1 Tax=Pseudoalteromonas piscicida TaxID=43662 RepID=A0ABN5CEB8_PSEO7|nr:hypothetical protein PPIS_a0083 [Pseudoalteromonas piscicida]